MSSEKKYQSGMQYRNCQSAFFLSLTNYQKLTDCQSYSLKSMKKTKKMLPSNWV